MRAKTALSGLLFSLVLTAGASAQPASREILVSPTGIHPAVAVTGDGSVWNRNAATAEKSGMFLRRFTID